MCPICGFAGKFRPYRNRAEARCPRCRSLERHRAQVEAARRCGVLPLCPTWRVLHCAPEPCLGRLLKVSQYTTLGMNQPRVDVEGDLRALPFPEGQFDLVWASHVLEHILEVEQAIAEIHRVLRPGGLALVDVPMSSAPTCRVDPTPKNHYHHWRPGVGWANHYTSAGFKVLYQSRGICVCQRVRLLVDPPESQEPRP